MGTDFAETLQRWGPTYINPFNGPLSRTTRVNQYQKGKTIWILLKEETVSGSGISLAICKSAPRSRQTTMPAPHHSVFTGRMPFLPPNQQCQSTEGTEDGDQIHGNSMGMGNRDNCCGCLLSVVLNKINKQISLKNGQIYLTQYRQLHRHTWTVQSYFPGGANVHLHLIHVSLGPHKTAPQMQSGSIQFTGVINTQTTEHMIYVATSHILIINSYLI